MHKKYNKSQVIIIFALLIMLILISSHFIEISNSASISNHILNDEYNIYSRTDNHSVRFFQNEPFYHKKIYNDNEILDLEINEESFKILNDGPMDSAWPMYCHDTCHTGRSPYSTVYNSGYEKWRFELSHTANGDVAIDDNGTTYFGADGLYVVNPNGTLKWKYTTNFLVDGAPAIDRDGIIYFGTVYGSPSYLFAVYPNGTLKWKWSAGGVFGSPAIGNDSTIYFGGDNHYINALYPNGTLKWRYQTGHVVYSSPAIGQDSTVYCGSHDTYLYALYPDNGTLKWKYKTGDWIRTSPCIADDGTIYVVSLDGYLYAVYPNGTLNWKTSGCAGTSPTIGQDGTIYCGYDNLYAINPTNGSVKWIFNPGPGRSIRGGTPCNSVDGTIYFGTSDGGEIIAVNPDGTEKWRKGIGTVESAPAIGEDGTVYVGSSHTPDDGYFYAFGIGPLEADANGPYYGLINEPMQFTGVASGGYSPYTYHWEFGDDHTSDEQNPTHAYTTASNYTITFTVTDNTSNTSIDSTWAWIQETNTPPQTPTISGETRVKTGKSYDYSFITSDPDENNVWYYIDWGDNTNTQWIGPYLSGKQITQSHTWNTRGTYMIKAKAKDTYNAESDWGTLRIRVPISNNMVDSPFLQFLERFLENHPHVFPALMKLFGMS